VLTSSRFRPLRNLALPVAAALALVAALLAGTPGPARAAVTLPCDIYAAAGTPCVAAHSTVRALFADYDGPLYQVKRVSDGSTENISPLTTGGYANAAAQTSFCANTTCTITEIYDQSGHNNNLTIEGPGGNGGQDVGANASALPVMAGGHLVYGVYVTPGVGYRNDSTTDVATGDDPQGEYMVTSADHVNGGCCFDYGNAETNNDDNGNGHMDAINFSTECWFSPCSGSGPWVQADLENGLFAGANGSDTGNEGNTGQFVTALVKNNGTTTYAIKGGNAQSGGLTTWYAGALPDIGGYAPMHQEGAIILGTGGDDSNSSVGSFFEGVMTSGYPTDAADNSVQANIVSVGYAVPSAGGSGIIAAGDDSADCADLAGGADTPGTKVEMWPCDGNPAAQTWTMASNDTVQIGGGCLDITGANYSNGTLVEWWTCNGGANQVWEPEGNGELVNPTSGKCLDDPAFNTTAGTQLILYSCNGGTNQQWGVPAG
jgi:hypothetical protein